MKTRSTKPKSKRNTKYNRKTHRKPKKSLHKKRRSRDRKYGGDLSTIGRFKDFFGMASCGDKTDNYEKIVCEIKKINRNIEELKKDKEQFMEFKKKGNENVMGMEIYGPSRNLYEETLDKITKLINYFKGLIQTDERITDDMRDELTNLENTFDLFTDNAYAEEILNIPMYKFIHNIMPIMESIYSLLVGSQKHAIDMVGHNNGRP